MKIKLLLFIIAITFTCRVSSQKIIINGEETNRKLLWSDFTGDVERNSPYAAMTRWKVKSTFSGFLNKGDSSYIDNLEVTLELDPEKSWAIKTKQSDNLLIHEQGHFDLGKICMNELIKTYKQTAFSINDFSPKFQAIMSTVLQKYSNLGNKYDEETKHGLNKEEQKKWNSFFAKKFENN